MHRRMVLIVQGVLSDASFKSLGLSENVQRAIDDLVRRRLPKLSVLWSFHTCETRYGVPDCLKELLRVRRASKP